MSGSSFTYVPLGDGYSVDLNFQGRKFSGIEISKEELPYFSSIILKSDEIVVHPGYTIDFLISENKSWCITDSSFAFITNKQVHRDDDRPAIIFTDGCKEWLKEGKCHRETGPASIFANGTERYFLDDICISKEKWEDKIWQKNIGNDTAEYYAQFEAEDPPTEITVNGTKYWRNLNNQLHRGNDRPAIIWRSGDLAFYKNGKTHRANGPAYIFGEYNKKSYWLDNIFYPDKEKWEEELKKDTADYWEQFEKEDPPTEIFNGIKYWRNSNNELHRDNGRPARISSMSLQWFSGGELHRNNDLPAIVYLTKDCKCWINEGKYHRLTGPAIEGSNSELYCINGIYYSFKEWEKKAEELIFKTNQEISKKEIKEEKSDLNFFLGAMGLSVGITLLSNLQRQKKKSLPKKRKQEEVILEENVNDESKNS